MLTCFSMYPVSWLIALQLQSTDDCSSWWHVLVEAVPGWLRCICLLAATGTPGMCGRIVCCYEVGNRAAVQQCGCHGEAVMCCAMLCSRAGPMDPRAC